MTRLLLLRHGRTDWNLLRRIQGRTDTDLSHDGLKEVEARRLPDDFNHFAVVTSPLNRARQTAQALGLRTATIEPRLIEMNWGEWEGRTLEELRAELGDAMSENEARGLDFRPPGGESPREVQARLTPWLVDVARAGHPTLAVTHKGVIRALLAMAYAWDMRGKPPVKLDWTAAHLFQVGEGGDLHPIEVNRPLDEGV